MKKERRSDRVKQKKASFKSTVRSNQNTNAKKPKRILMIGSGALMIGQAGEFDYSGSQAIKALKEEGITTILINPNIATYQTSVGVADIIYFLPITPYFVEKIIAKERPDGILLSFGGQTALNCGLELESLGILKKYNVTVLGTPVRAIRDTEDRNLFVNRLNEIQVTTAKSRAVHSLKDAYLAAKEIGYPVMLRSGFALGGKGSGVARTEQELKELAETAFSFSPQVLVEEYLGGWKEIEYEVVRDQYDNCITVCNMENFDPMGIHTGESIVVAPSQTLTNTEYHMLREIAIRVVRHLGIIGECNIQYALDPTSHAYRVIEVNARLSRSSALASKATGYPLAFVAAKIACGYALHEIKNTVTGVTGACFEPALDYVVIKMPQWDLQKFAGVDRTIGSDMKSVGEVMAIGRTFEETLQKALRMLHNAPYTLTDTITLFENVKDALKKPTDQRIFAIAQAMHAGMSVDEIYAITNIDKFFLAKIAHIYDLGNKLRKEKLTKELLMEAKQRGFSDSQIAKLVGKDAMVIRALRKKDKILPQIKQIDTLAGEFPAKTNYLYMTYNGTEHDVKPSTKSIIVLGSGAYKIGSSVEFDWCCVQAIQAAREEGYTTIMHNYNPETVSTDYDMSDRLYFEELSFERVLDIYEFENPVGIILSMGGQIPNNLAIPLEKHGVRILGTRAQDIDRAEDRHKFAKLLDELEIAQPLWKESTNEKDACAFAAKAGYPILVRPSYVLSGAAMQVVFNEEQLFTSLHKAGQLNTQHSVVMSQFIEGAKEIEIDAVANEGELLIWAISEHVENAGVHSGDATIILPAQKVYQETHRRIKGAARKIAHALHITGPFNIQFLAKDNEIKVIECNLRASRSFPFCSKVMKHNFISLATKAILGKKVNIQNASALELEYVGVKSSQFSFHRLKGADPLLSVEMASTGEVACLGDTLEEAFLKAFLATGMNLPKKNILLSTGPIKEKITLLSSVQTLKQLGYTLYATKGTAAFLKEYGISITPLTWPDEQKEPNTITFLREHKIDLVINIPKSNESKELDNDYVIRRTAIDYNIPLITNAQLFQLFVRAISKYRESDLQIKQSEEYR